MSVLVSIGRFWVARDVMLIGRDIVGDASQALWKGGLTFVYQDETEVVSCGVFLVYFAECGC